MHGQQHIKKEMWNVMFYNEESDSRILLSWYTAVLLRSRLWLLIVNKDYKAEA